MWLMREVHSVKVGGACLTAGELERPSFIVGVDSGSEWLRFLDCR